MIDLKNILQSNAGCLSSRASFKSVLMDKYPGEKRTVNILTIMYECGIVQKIKSKSMLGENDFQAIILQLENDYGIAAKYSSECVSIWADALGVEVQALRQQPSPLVIHEQIVHKPIVDAVVVEGSKSDYETEVLKSGTLRITKFVGFDEREITIPNKLDGMVVTVVGENAFAKCTGIHKVIIPEGITTIENGAFCGCESLMTVLLPTTLKWLGNEPRMKPKAYSWETPTELPFEGVFEGTAIRSIDLPAGLTYLARRAFRQCKNLTHVDLPNEIKVVPEYCFYYCSALKSIVLPDNVSSIQTSAFANTGTLNSAVPYAVDDALDDGEWFYLDAFREKEYCLDILKGTFNGTAYQAIGDEEFEIISFLLSYQDDGYVYFQRVFKAQVLRQKRICFGDTVTFQQNSREIVINSIPDAIYSAAANRLYFQKLSTISSIFKGIDQIYKEATEEETNAFLTSDFIVTDEAFDASCVKKPNRKRIALAKEAMDGYDDEQKNAVFSSIRTYYPSIINDDNTFRVSSEEDLTYLLYGVMQRFYTTADGREKRIASSVRSI